ncbi:MAG: ArsR/SmtB family transcription factor [Acidimicrobiia bacterium]
MATNAREQAWATVSDNSRRSIVLLLAERPHAVRDLAEALPISRPAVSQHLKILKDAGLVAEEAAGTRRVYHLNEAGLLALRDQLDTFWDRALSSFRDLTDTPPEDER